MRRITHLLIGMAAGVLVAYYTGRFDYRLPLSGAFFGILPDFDIFLAKLGIAEHRGAYSHSLGSSIVLSGTVFCGLYFGAGWERGLVFWLSAVVFLATLLHTVTDCLTYAGAKLFYPLSGRKLKGGLKYDDWLVNGLLILLCVLLIAYFGQGFAAKYIT
jgi:membrane-bound metal-dependent hydrolase YbcI (DUF457 family)